MARYTFVCHDCNVRFEKSLKMGEWPLHPCPECKEESPRVFDGQTVSAKFEAPPNAAPANTGVHSLDYPTADMAVGRSADERWAVLGERAKAKEAARKLGDSGLVTRIDGDGYVDYSPLPKALVAPRRELAKEARKRLIEKKAARTE